MLGRLGEMTLGNRITMHNYKKKLLHNSPAKRLKRNSLILAGVHETNIIHG
jgi:hypothetical protein